MTLAIRRGNPWWWRFARKRIREFGKFRDDYVLTRVSAEPAPPPTETRYLLMPETEFMSLPTSGAAWDHMKARADAVFPAPNLQDQNMKVGVQALAAAMVYARTGQASYRTKARDAIMAALSTWEPILENGALSIGRQLGSYVLAADFVGLSSQDDTDFRDFLQTMRTAQLGTHPRWQTLHGTHEDSNNNWGSFAGASRLATSLYLDDAADVTTCANVFKGFMGDRTAWDQFRGQGAKNSSLYADERTWACDDSASAFIPINPACVKSGIDIDGAIVGDIYRGGPLQWPAPSRGISYTLESFQGLIVQAELLYRNGFADIWMFGDAAMKRAGDIVSRNQASGGSGWNFSAVNYHVQWLMNRRLGTSYPTIGAQSGRLFGFTDWLYG